MRVDHLESRVGKLEKALSAFSEELRFALRYIQHDAASSLTKSRVVLEKLLVRIYTVEMGQEPRKPLLGDILVDNQFTRKIDRRILSRMNSIRDMGNLGSHGEPVQPSDAARVLDDLCEVLEWFLQRNAGSDPSLPADRIEDIGPETALGQPSARRDQGDPILRDLRELRREVFREALTRLIALVTLLLMLSLLFIWMFA
jgi:hypothetical protein